MGMGHIPMGSWWIDWRRANDVKQVLHGRQPMFTFTLLCFFVFVLFSLGKSKVNVYKDQSLQVLSMAPSCYIRGVPVSFVLFPSNFDSALM